MKRAPFSVYPFEGLTVELGLLRNAPLQLVLADAPVIFSALFWPTSVTQVKENESTCREAQSDRRFVRGKPK